MSASAPAGRLTLEVLRDRVARGDIETVVVAFPDHYGRLMGKRFDAEYFVADGAAHGTHACDYLLTTDMEMEPVQGYRFASWEKGYGDFHLVPDPDTLVLASWLEKSALVLCDLADDRTGDPVAVAPRSILRRQVDAARTLDYSAVAASELEYYVFQQSYRQARKRTIATSSLPDGTSRTTTSCRAHASRRTPPPCGVT